MKKSRKSKIVLLSVLGLATVSLATVGFASWVISGVTPATSENISVSAGEVVDKALSASISNTELSVAFDNLAKPGEGELANGNTGKEDLVFSFKATVSATDEAYFSGLKFTFTLNETFEGLFDTGESSNKYLKFISYSGNTLVKEFVYYKSDSSLKTLDNPSKDVTLTTGGSISYTDKIFTCTFSFGWGNIFGKVNPSTAYKNATGDTAKSTVITNLKNFKKAFDSISASPLMSVVVTPVAA